MLQGVNKKGVSSVRTPSFEYAPDEHNYFEWEHLVYSIILVQTDHPYSARREQSCENSSHHVLTLNDMKKLA